MSGETFTLIAAGLAIAGFVQGLTGFGFGMISMALLPLAIAPGVARDIVTLVGLPTFVLTTGVTIRHVRWHDVGHLAIGAMIGVVIGFYALTGVESATIKQVLGVVLCVLSIYELMVKERIKGTLPHWTGWGMGLLSGLLTGAFNIGGPPLVAYVYAQPGDKEQHVGMLSIVFLVGSIMRVVLLVAGDQLTIATWSGVAWGIGPTMLAIIAGNRLLARVTPGRLRSGVFIALFGIGLWYVTGG